MKSYSSLPLILFLLLACWSTLYAQSAKHSPHVVDTTGHLYIHEGELNVMIDSKNSPIRMSDVIADSLGHPSSTPRLDALEKQVQFLMRRVNELELEIKQMKQ
jgi:hypothetical protein